MDKFDERQIDHKGCGSPSQEEAYKWNRDIISYLKDGSNSHLYVVYKGEKCFLRIDPETGDVQIVQTMPNGQSNYLLLKLRKDVCLTIESADQLKEYDEQQELARYRRGTRQPFSPYLTEFINNLGRSSGKKPKKSEAQRILDNPEISHYLDELKRALETSDFYPGPAASSYMLFANNREAGQILNSLFLFLYEKGYTVKSDPCFIKMKKNMLLISDSENARLLIDEIAKIAGCWEGVSAYLEAKRPQSRGTTAIVLYDGENRNDTFNNIDCASVINWYR